jgi:Protein of unknown function (DUF2939)
LSDNPNQVPEGARRRIVIPLNQEPAGTRPKRAASVTTGGSAASGTPRKSRVGKVLAVLGITFVIIVLLAVGGVFLWWRHYQTTPTYALAVLVDAAQRNDMATVDTIVDMDKIVNNLTAQVTEKAAGRYGGALSGEIRKVIEARLPALLPAIKGEVRNAVTDRVRKISAQADKKPFFVVAVALPFVVKVTTTGDEIADAAITIQDRQINLGLARNGDAWKLVSVKDDALVQQMVDNLIKELPAIGLNTGPGKQKSLKPPAAFRIP